MNGNGNRKRKKRIIIVSIIGALLIVAVVLVVLGSNRERVITVQTEKIERRTITQIVTASGKIQPETQVKINAEVSGEIIELPVKEGNRVRKGDLLVRIKPDAYQAQLERAEAALAVAEAGLQKSEAEFKRVSDLYQKNLVSTAEMDIARASFLTAQASYAQSRASVKEYRETLAKTTILAPMNGTVSSLKSELGERVSGSAFMQGSEIMTVADLSRMEARVEVGENDIVLISIGDTARIQVDAYPQREFVGIVSQIANTATITGLRTQEELTNFEVRMLILPPEGITFRPGMSMTADIETETRDSVLAVPIQSVTTRMPKMEKKEEEQAPAEGEAQLEATKKKKKEEQVNEVIFLVENGKAKMVKVKRGISNDTHVELLEGGEEGKEVVSGPFRVISRELEDGSTVKVDNRSGRRPAVASNE